MPDPVEQKDAKTEATVDEDLLPDTQEVDTEGEKETEVQPTEDTTIDKDSKNEQDAPDYDPVTLNLKAVQEENEQLKARLKDLGSEFASLKELLGKNEVFTKEELASLQKAEQEEASRKGLEAAREKDLEQLKSLMRVHPAYPQFDEYVTQENINKVIDVITDEAYASGEVKGRTRSEIRAEVKENLYSKSNPFEYVYGLVDLSKKGSRPTKKIPGTLAAQGTSGVGGTKNDKFANMQPLDMVSSLRDGKLTDDDMEALLKGD